MTIIPPANRPTGSPDIVRIRAARLADAPQVSELLTAAFLVSPVGDWLIPDLTTRQTVYRRFFRIHVDHALRHGRIDLTHDGDGAAVWLPHPSRVGEPHDYGARLAAACGPWLRRFELLDEVSTARHPATWHHYLAFIGVHPDRQCEGIGSTLLADHTARLDQRQIPAYLEASTPHSRDLYLRHGFRVVDAGPIAMPEDGPPIWPMWRTPTTTSSLAAATIAGKATGPIARHEPTPPVACRVG